MDRNDTLELEVLYTDGSLSARRAWIEILTFPGFGMEIESLSARRAWIEISDIDDKFGGLMVALRKESVDRNMVLPLPKLLSVVALRKESVDRNPDFSGLWHGN